MSRLDRGLLQVYTGEGKGKTTAACGLAVRARGRGLDVCFVQFVKGGEPSGELSVLTAAGVEVVRPAVVTTGLMGGVITPEDRGAAQEAFEIARRAIATGSWDVVILDELCVALHYGLVDTGDALLALTGRPHNVEVVCTGRNAPKGLVDAADLVTEMRAVKHPYEDGVAARRGIEF